MTLANGNFIIDDELQRRASDFVGQITDHDVDAVTNRFNGQDVSAPPELAQFLTSLLESDACGGRTNVQTLPTELTTTAAADVLGASRPTLMKLVRGDSLRARNVGTHTRVLTKDVLYQRDVRNELRRLTFRRCSARPRTSNSTDS
ncbi:helix-turn-helix domain-containing protein [Agrococcus sp. Ld7]|uniref:helix-turn-helix domain-containing protein n=1 Tax=Agrococcus sp. Ld7 TaxID=649148 RepID=UPI00386B9A0A